MSGVTAYVELAAPTGLGEYLVYLASDVVNSIGENNNRHIFVVYWPRFRDESILERHRAQALRVQALGSKSTPPGGALLQASRAG